jgi:hypothetical protein
VNALAEEEGLSAVDPRTLRVSDAERQHVVGVLEKAVGRGMITLEEFSARTDRALAARTRGELNSVLVDLPGVLHREPATEEPLVLRTGAGTVRQNGAWTVPGTITAQCGMGTLLIDFTDAVCRRRAITLHATCGAGSITVIVPRGWTVVMAEAVTKSGTVVNKATDPPDPDLPALRVYGRAGMGTVKIRHPRGRRGRAR